jgi:hypothetical protein
LGDESSDYEDELLVFRTTPKHAVITKWTKPVPMPGKQGGEKM